MMITDKLLTQNGADFTFVCGKVPFAISCSSDLPHKSSNLIDLDLINKMKIPLKNIRVTRISIQGHDLRCVGVVSQTIQCVIGGKISGTIHLYAKVVRDLFNSISTDCLASKRTYSRLMGEDPPEEPPDDPTMEILGGDEDAEEENVPMSSADGENVPMSSAEGENVPMSKAEEENVPMSKAEEEDAPACDDNEEDIEITKGIPSYCYSSTPYDEKSLYPDEWQDCYDSDGNYDPVLSDFINNEHPPDVYYQGGKLHRMRKRVSPTSAPGTRSTSMSSPEEVHCQFCFLSGQPIKVTRSHRDMDIECPSMSDVDRRRIHGDQETDRWLARIHGYPD